MTSSSFGSMLSVCGMVCRCLDRPPPLLSSLRNWRTWPWTRAELRPWSVTWQDSRTLQCAGTRREGHWALHRRLRWGSKMAVWDWCCMVSKRRTRDDTRVLHRITSERTPPRLTSLLMVYSKNYLLTYLRVYFDVQYLLSVVQVVVVVVGSTFVKRTISTISH